MYFQSQGKRRTGPAGAWRLFSSHFEIPAVVSAEFPHLNLLERSRGAIMLLSSLGNRKVNRWTHFAAMALIGDGVVGLIRPGRDAQAWAKGPLIWRRLMRGLVDRPILTRAIAAAEVAGAVYWILSREESR
jgi:hypothetical protein